MVLDVSEARRGDHAYFTALASEISKGGTEAFLNHIQNVDVKGFNPRSLPRSNALQVQKLETLMRTDAVAAFWHQVLSDGFIALEDASLDWDSEIPVADLEKAYLKSTARHRNAPAWGGAARRLRQLMPGLVLTKSRTGQGAIRRSVYKLPDLTEARKAFRKATGVDPCES